MKNLFGIIFVSAICIPLFGQTPSGFIISADWINNENQPGGHPYTMTAQDWINIKDLGLTWGEVIYDMRNTPTDLTYANSALDGAEQNGIKLILDRYMFREPTQGQRWQYHPEYSQQYPSFTGRIGGSVLENTGGDPDFKATLFPDDDPAHNNTWRAQVGTDLPGYMAKGLKNPFCLDQSDGYHYNVKMRVRLGNGTSLTEHTEVLTVFVVRISDGEIIAQGSIYTDQFGTGYNYSYIEMPVTDFIKIVSGMPSVRIQPQALTSSAPGPNPYGPTGIISTPALPIGSIYDYQVYWPGNVTCYLDYIIIDDDYANQTFTGVYDSQIDQEVNNFKSRSGLGRYNVNDEVDPAYYGQYLTNGYVEKRIKALVVPAGYPTKTGFHYNVGYWEYARGGGTECIGRDIVWTQNNESMTDIYPIGLNTPLPDDGSYTQTYQNNVIQPYLINYLQPSISYANRYSVPFWFTPQVDNWGGVLREPTTLEIQQMVNLGLVYGAKGINYFLYYTALDTSGNVLANGLVDNSGAPRRTIYSGTSYAGDKWATVKAMNQRLAIIGPTLVGLTWQNAFSIHTLNGGSTGTYITTVTTPDDPGQRYVELGEFIDASSNKYFMLVNRRTISTESRNITVTFNYTTPSEILDIVSGKIWVIGANGNFTDYFQPGEGKLYQIKTPPDNVPGLAYANKSTSWWPTSYNNQHPIERSPDGKLHQVFSSGGEIFYRRSTNNGSSWDITMRLSSGNGSNDCPSIAAGYYSSTPLQLGLVWQRQLTSNTYEIWYAYSSDVGTTWTTFSQALVPNFTVSYVQSNAGYGQGPTPVIATYQAIESSLASFIIVYADENGLHYAASRNCQNNMVLNSNVVPGTSNGANIWHPSLASYNASGNQNMVGLVYADKYSGLYSQRYVSYSGYESWDSNPVSIRTGTYIMSPSLAIDYSGSTYAAWGAYNGSDLYTLRFNQGLANGQWGSWYKEWQVIGVDIYFPCITYFYYSGHIYPNQLAIVTYGGDGATRETRWSGSGQYWSGLTVLAGTGYSPNISHETQGSGLPIEEYADGTVNPYLITQSPLVPSQQKTGLAFAQRIERAAELYNKADRSLLRVQLSQPVFTTASGDTIAAALPFKEYDYSQPLSLSTANIFDYLQTENVEVPSNATSVSFNATVSIDMPDTLSDGALNDSTTSAFRGVILGLNAQRRIPILSNQSFSRAANSRHFKSSRLVVVPIHSLRGATVSFDPTGKLMGQFNEADLAFSLVNVIVSGASSGGSVAPTISSPLSPENVALGQNYPNPFNPATTIVYRVTHAGRVSLKIFDELGREVATLVNSDQDEGVHSQRFDASHLASGIYFYQLIAPGVNETRKMLIAK